MRAGLIAFPFLAKCCADSFAPRLGSLRLFHASQQPSIESKVPPSTPNKLPRIHILGLGNVGMFIAHALAGQAVPRPPPITLMLWKDWQSQEFEDRRRMITVHRGGLPEHKRGFDLEVLQDNVWHHVPMKTPGTESASNPAADSEIIENLILAMKSKHIQMALESVKHRLTPHSTIVMIHMGVGVEEEINKNLFPDPETRPSYIFGTTSHMLYQIDPFNIDHAGVGTCVFSVRYTNPQAKAAAEKAVLERQQSPPAADWDSDEEEHHRELQAQYEETKTNPATQMWASSSHYLLRTLTRNPQLVASAVPAISMFQYRLEKAAQDSITGPLTVMFDALHGDLLYNPHVDRIQRLLLIEISTVICALPELQGVPGLRARFAPDRLRTLAGSLAANSAKRVNMMLADVRYGNKTDIKYANGYFVKRGEELGIKCALNYMMIQLVLAKQKTLISRNFEDVPVVQEPKAQRASIDDSGQAEIDKNVSE
ncbi:hypothetical protein FQN53_007914 [Emmonsiellopsis sp. PD_33]|nr:hypothetical protein FQN53_007914 [Emmonsiellopsis sp. PD_33]